MYEITFWVAAGLLIYPYFGYPLLLWAWGVFAGRSVRKESVKKKVTVIIPAYNEASHIEGTLTNKLDQTYAAENLEIIVVSDESTDGTDEIVQKYTGDRVRLIRQQPRAGKAAGLNLAVQQARGDIIVFSDANTIFDRDAVENIVMDFADPTVGYVTGSMGFLQPDGTVAGEGISAYMRLENSVRKLETRFWSIVGSNGGVDAIRKELYVEIPKDQITDFVLPLSVNAQGYRVIYDGQVQAWEYPNEALDAEFRMRVRVALRALRGMIYMRRLFNPLKYFHVAVSLISHKLLRYLAPVFMTIVFFANLLLAVEGGSFYLVLFGAQLGFYLLAFFGWKNIHVPFVGAIARLIAYFVASNIAFGIAWIKLFRGEKMAIWKPRAG